MYIQCMNMCFKCMSGSVGQVACIWCIYDVCGLYVNYKTCTYLVSDMYLHCMYMYSQCTDNVYLLLTCFNMSIPCIYRSKDIHTWYIQVQTCIYSFSTKSKRSIIWGLEPMTSCILASCLDRSATSVLAIRWRFVVLVKCLPGGWWHTFGAGPAAPPSLAITFPVHQHGLH
jgi:hypothetical protein